LSNEQVVAQQSLGVAPLNWEIAGFGDFNGTGRQGILWYDTGSGSVVAWLMNGFAVSPEWVHNGPISLDWQIRGTPDVFGDGVNSILWSNTTTGQQVIWVPVGTQFPGTFIGAASPNWAVQP
jgi:hypothetical protein